MKAMGRFNGLGMALALALLCVLGSVSCATGTSIDGDVEICDDGLDNDGDGFVDCDDNDCGLTVQCQSPDTESACDDGVDNDEDGDTDCDDADCASSQACQTPPEDCTDGVDNDGDTLIDCADPNCNGDPACAGPQEICDDGVDNDGDTLIDCADPNCNGDPACQATEVCDDGVDNDGDGFADCDDPDCDTAPECATPTVETNCTDGLDDDLDGTVDCADLDCSTVPPCDRCYDTFSDVDSSYWAYDHIRALYVHEVVDGCVRSPLSYCPDDVQLRMYFAVMLVRAMGESPSTAAMDAYFSDLTDAATAPYINRLFELGITNGCVAGLFCPDDAVVRQDAAIFIIRALGESPSTVADDAYFSDLTGAYAIGFINRLFELGITNGCGGNNYCPFDDLIRASGATFIALAFGYTDDFCGF